MHRRDEEREVDLPLRLADERRDCRGRRSRPWEAGARASCRAAPARASPGTSCPTMTRSIVSRPSSGVASLHLRVAEELGHVGRRPLRAVPGGIEDDHRLEVLERVGVPAVHRLVAALRQQVGRRRRPSRRRRSRSVTSTFTWAGGGPSRIFDFGFSPTATLVAFAPASGSGFRNSSAHALDLLVRREELEVRSSRRAARARAGPGRGSRSGARRRASRTRGRSPARARRPPPTPTVTCRLDRVDDPGQLEGRREAAHLLLDRLHELLLARVSIQVRVGVPVAHEREGVLARRAAGSPGARRSPSRRGGSLLLK